ncbi:unnamed protein product [Lepidochelys olivacea]
MPPSWGYLPLCPALQDAVLGHFLSHLGGWSRGLRFCGGVHEGHGGPGGAAPGDVEERGEGQVQDHGGSHGMGHGKAGRVQVHSSLGGALGIEFDWKYIQMSVDSNISLVHYIAMAALVWMFTRYNLPLTLLLGLSIYKAFFMESFVHIFLLGSWMALLVNAVITGFLVLSSLGLFVTSVHGN